ncbi:MAG: RNA-directed polymerase [Halanaerobiales bacterium]|nr:RNA-directed polymerase [Halanaerobiales bacterium]
MVGLGQSRSKLFGAWTDNVRAALRGGYWNNGSNARAGFALNLNNPPSNANINIGFRAASPNCARRRYPTWISSSALGKGVQVPVAPETRPAKNINRQLMASRLRPSWAAALIRGVRKIAKTYTNLYPRIYDFQNLELAYMKARRAKRFQEEVLQFSFNLESNLIQIQNELIYKTFRTGRYRYFYVHDPKTRLVAALPFKDRVVQHALCNVIEPLFEERFIPDSYACRVGRGIHAGADRVMQFLRVTQHKWDRVYCLKADVSQYFPSINHAILKAIIRKRIACPDTLWLIDEIIDSGGDGGDCSRGLPIGNLTSQLWANVYLDQLDHFVKEILREKYYVRYMDDFVILGGDKRHLWEVKQEIEGFLADKLDLQLNGKTGIWPISQGIDFLGYRIWPTHRLIRKSSIKRMKRKLKAFQRKYREGKIDLEKINATIQSWLGHVSHADSYNLRKKLLGCFVLTKGGDAYEENEDEPDNPVGR